MATGRVGVSGRTMKEVAPNSPSEMAKATTGVAWPVKFKGPDLKADEAKTAVSSIQKSRSKELSTVRKDILNIRDATMRRKQAALNTVKECDEILKKLNAALGALR